MNKPESPKWSKEFARRWNAETHTVFVLHGNIFDIFPVPVNDSGKFTYSSLKVFFARRLFNKRKSLLFYDISEGLSFASSDMQTDFMAWLSVRDEVEKTKYAINGPPKDFNLLAPILKGYFQSISKKDDCVGATLVINFPEKIVPASEESMASKEERQSTVNILKWATSLEMRSWDVGIFLVAETLGEVNKDILSNPYVAQVEIGLPGEAERISYLETEWADKTDFKAALKKGGIGLEDLGKRTSGLNLIRLKNLILEAVHNGDPITSEYIAMSKKRLIEEFCQGLVKFKEPVTGRSLDMVATHKAAKEKLKELAWLIKNGKGDVMEKGVLIPGRIGVGKSWLVDCFASECGLPVLEMGEFRSKWVGDTESQQAKILLTLKALGPVIVVVDEADQVFGSSRDQSSGDSGVSGRVFAAFAAHIGDSSLRGRELWFAMTSRPDLLAIDMKRQGRFGLCIPLFPSQTSEEVEELFVKVSGSKGLVLNREALNHIIRTMGDKEMTGSEVESIVVRAMEAAVLSGRDKKEVSTEDFKKAADDFIDSLDPNVIELQIVAGVVSCSDKRFLPNRFTTTDMSRWHERFEELKLKAGRK